MKRIRIWLNSFNLFQQFITISVLTIFVFVFIFITTIDSSIDAFVNNQMYSYLHQAQEDYEINNDRENINVTNIIYSLRNNKYLSNTDDFKEFVSSINPEVESDSLFVLDNKEFIYSIKHIDNDDYSLISIINNNYRDDYKNTLFNSVINSSIYVFGGLFVLLMLWVLSLIRPLNLITNYINRLKKGESPKLVIKRRDEIGEVAEALDEMNDELSKQKRIREEMIQNISHDLKTPIATIKSYSESIKDGIYPYDTLEKSVDVIIEHADRLEKKVYSLIEFNKFGYLKDDESGNELLMNDVIGKAILSTKVLRNDIVIETNLDENVYFHGQEEPWRVVVENLLDNSIRYAKSKIVINLQENGLDVFNDGELMTKERLDKLFKPYEKGTDGNFGLGLSIIKKICDTYGYSVVGENMNDGVIFRISRLEKKNKKTIV